MLIDMGRCRRRSTSRDARLLFASTSEVYGNPAVHPQVESYWGNVNPHGIRSCYDEGICHCNNNASIVKSLRSFSRSINRTIERTNASNVSCAIGKRCGESLCFDYHRQYNVDIRVARIFNSYGARMAENDGRVISNFIMQVLSNQNITIFGDGSQVLERQRHAMHLAQ